MDAEQYAQTAYQNARQAAPPDVDLAKAARLLVRWMSDPEMTPEKVGYPIDLWVALVGGVVDADDPHYEEGLERALALAVTLADPEPEPAQTVVVTDVVVVRGEVL